ncbi:MAG: hypothetical protein L0Y58_09955 [Verrucomicrobia subdivision 3 bacterium]|nr:hypothetical protein [Limisphaerales bacterium]
MVALAVIGFFIDRRASKLQLAEDKKADTAIANAVARAEESKTEQEKLRKEAEEAKLARVELDKQVLDLRLKLQDRRITPDQHTNLFNCLRQGVNGPVTIALERRCRNCRSKTVRTGHW